MAGIIFGGFICVLRWVIDQNKETLRNAHEARMRSVEGLTKQTEAIKEFATQVSEAHKYQKDEHERLLQTHEKILASTDKLFTNQDTDRKALKEVEQQHRRTNGYSNF